MSDFETVRFSVGIPAYKGAYIRECILSVLNQTYDDFELIIVNDASPDPIDNIVSEFSDPRIKYSKNKENLGGENVVDNWNKCLEKAKGKYFVIMGDDDKMEPNFLSEFDKLINRYPALNVYHCRSKIIDKDSKPLTLTPSWPEFESVYDNIWHKLFSNRLHYISDFVYSTDFLQEMGGFYHLPLAWATDAVTSYIAMGDKGIAHTNKPLLNYRRHATTISSSGNEELKLKAVILQYTWFQKFLKERPTDMLDRILYDDICKNILKCIQKEKVYVLKNSYHNNEIKSFFNWISARKEYSLSLREVVYSFLIYLKTRVVREKFD